MATNRCVESLIIQQLSSDHSNASSRTIINDNFKKLTGAVKCINQFLIDELSKIVYPTNPDVGSNYSLQYDGEKYILTEINTSPGNKYNIENKDAVSISKNYQYLIFDHLFIDGTLELKDNSELVII